MREGKRERHKCVASWAGEGFISSPSARARISLQCVDGRRIAAQCSATLTTSEAALPTGPRDT